MQQKAQKQVGIPDSVYKNRYKISVIVLIGILMSVLDGYIVTIALPTITTYFNVDVAQSQWIITGYLVVMTALFIFFGKFSEYTCKTKLFLIGWVLFTLSSLACGLSSGITEIIIFRIAQAAGASLVCSSLGLSSCELGYIEIIASRSSEIKDLFDIPEDHDICGILAIGYPAYTFKNWIDKKQPKITWKL